jgi:hypothetical protein
MSITISAITSGILYYITVTSIFQNETKDETNFKANNYNLITNLSSLIIDSDGSQPADTNHVSQFLDELTERGYLDFKAFLKDSIKDMVTDRSPFYEVSFLHTNEIWFSLSSHYITVHPL